MTIYCNVNKYLKIKNYLYFINNISESYSSLN